MKVRRVILISLLFSLGFFQITNAKAGLIIMDTADTTENRAPLFPGGDYALIDFLQSYLDYPEPALMAQLQGKVVVKLVIKADGTPSSFQVVKDIGSGCGEEAIRILSLMPNWTPAYSNGVAVDSAIYIPVQFKMVNSPAKFPGGSKALQDFISTMLIIPQEIRTKSLHGKIEMALFLTAEGNITHSEIIYNSLEMPSAEKAALDVVALMPKWIPKTVGQNKVASKTYITIEF